MIRISWKDLEEAFAFGSKELSFGIDKTTGKVVSLSEGDADPELLALLEKEPSRFLPVEGPDSHRTFQWAEEFAKSAESGKLAAPLQAALGGKKPFRRFKEVLAPHPDVREKWFLFEAAKIRELALEWAKANGVEIVGLDARP